MMSKDVKKTVATVVVLICSIFVLDRIGGHVMHELMMRSHDTTSPKITYLHNQCDSEVLFFGTSRCNVHYVAEMLEDSLHRSVYNCGVDGSWNIFAHYISLNMVLAYHTPKMVCLGVDAQDYIKEDQPFETVGYYAPFIGTSAAVDSVIQESGKMLCYKISHLYRYNAKALPILSGLSVGARPGNNRGYVSRPEPPVCPVLDENPITEFEIDALKVDYLKRFIQKCRERNIVLVFLVAPKLYRSGNEYDWLQQFCNLQQVPLFNYHSKGLFLDRPDYFWDRGHLWDKGARAYTAIVASDLKHLVP